MNVHRRFSPGLWSLPEFQSLPSMEPSPRALLLYLLACPTFEDFPGLLELDLEDVFCHLGWAEAPAHKASQHLLDNRLVVQECPYLWVPPLIHRHAPASPEDLNRWGRVWACLPEGELKAALKKALRRISRNSESDLAKSPCTEFQERNPRPQVGAMAVESCLPGLEMHVAPPPRKARSAYALPDLGHGTAWFEAIWRLWREHGADPGSKKIVLGRWVELQTEFHFSPRLLALAAWAYFHEEPKVQKGYIQALETFYGPKKATVLAWLDRAQELDLQLGPQDQIAWPTPLNSIQSFGAAHAFAW